MNGTIYDRFDEWFRCVDETYAAFSVAESPQGTPQDLEAAYAAKDRRCMAVNRLMAALAERCIPSISAGINLYYLPAYRMPEDTLLAPWEMEPAEDSP